MYVKNKKRNNQRAILVKIVAQKWGLDKRSVYRIIDGEQDNDAVLDDYMILKEQHEQLIENYQNNPLHNAVKQLVPII